jgi:hypothetical protein
MPSKHYDLTKTPKFIKNIFRIPKIIQIKLYKIKKVLKSKTFFERDYCVTFRLKIYDSKNPQISDDFNIAIPAKGAFFAKKKLEKHIFENLDIEVIRVDEVEIE